MNKFPRLLCLVLALCTAWPVFAETKSQQVERYLGTFRYENDRPRGTIKFIFQKAVLKRKGTGKKTYQYLLFNEPFFSNEDNAGRLIGIQIVNNGKTSTIRPESPEAPASVAEPAAPAVRVNVPNDPIRPQQGGGFNVGSMLDSSKVAGNLDQAKDRITGWKGAAWQTIRPVWAFVMWIFSSVIAILICFAGLCRYVAKTAATESLINNYGRIIVGRWIVSAHQNAAAMLLVITWIIAIVLLIDVFMWLVYLNLSVWLLVVIWFPILWLAEKLTSWLVPNIPISDETGIRRA